VRTDDLVLPERVVLLHIGPHKTGTTTVQSAFHNRRKRLLAQNVRYAGRIRQVYREARTIVGSDGVPGRRPPDMKVWDALVTEVVEAEEPRVVVSSEAFAGADDDIAARVIRELGKGRALHVVVTLRPLTKILPSQWQQFVQNGRRTRYDDWLNEIFTKEGERIGTFWRRHDHGALVRRWSAAAGPGNLTVVVADENDRDMVIRTFERFIAVTPGTLQPRPSDVNRSLTMSEIELVRQVNRIIRDEPWATTSLAQVIKDGVSDGMGRKRRPGPDEPQITTPRWALERAAGIAQESVDTIRSLGVRVVGDLDSITAMPPESAIRGDDYEMPENIPIEAAARAVVGAIRGCGLTPDAGTMRDAVSRSAKRFKDRLAVRSR
jgi:hypothetical protein